MPDDADSREPPAPEGRLPHGHGRRRRRKRRISIPAPLVFYVSAGFAVVSTALVYLRGERFLALSAASYLLILFVLIVNEHSNFARSRRQRRSREARVNFNRAEVTILFALLMLGIFVSLQAWIG